jgi:glycosyltransferase involved in cell wall biosynthesis
LPKFYSEFSGGAETQCFYLAQELLARGWKVHYIREADSPVEMVHEGIVVHAIPKRRKLFKWQNWFHLWRVMRRIQADFWYVRANISYLPQVAWHARKMRGETIWAFSSDSQFYITRRNIAGRHGHNVFAMTEHWLFFLALKRVSRIFVQTRNQLNLLGSKLGVSGELIYNAHPLPGVPGEPRKNVVVWIGRLHRNKHPEHFIAIANLLRQLPITFYLVGGTDNEVMAREVERQANAVPTVRWLGELAPREVHELLESSRVLVNTSDWEGFSNTFIEAWMRGVPVVSLHVDPDSFIAQGELGFVVGNTEHAARVIEQLISDGDMWRRMSTNCSDFARGNFCIGPAVDALEQSLLGDVRTSK